MNRFFKPMCIYPMIFRFRPGHIKLPFEGNCLTVQWLGLHSSTAGGPGSIPGQGTKIPQATRPKKAKNKIAIFVYQKRSNNMVQKIASTCGPRVKEPESLCWVHLQWTPNSPSEPLHQRLQITWGTLSSSLVDRGRGWAPAEGTVRSRVKH